MADIAISLPIDHPALGTTRIPRRLRALFRLAAMRRRSRVLAKALEFADSRMQADVGHRVRRHRHDWVEAFLAR